MKKRIIVISMMISGIICSVNAALILSYSADQPTNDVIVSYLPDSGTAGYGWQNFYTGRRDLGQSFLAPTNFTIEAISFNASAANGASTVSAGYTIKIFEGDTRTTTPTNSNLISTQTGTYFSDTATVKTGGWVTFDIDDITATAGKYYTFMFSWDGASAEGANTMVQAWYNVATGTYDDGQTWWSGNSDTYASTTRDLVFVVQGTVIPEPASAFLLAAGCSAVLLLRRFKRK